MKFIYIFSLLTCFLGEVFAVSPEAEFKKLQETWILQSDGSQEYRCYKELTLYTHTAMNSTYGETFILYNPDYQELKIHQAYVRQKDGTQITTPANAFIEVLPQHAAKAPAYNRLKEMVVVHTGLDLGCTLYLDYSIYTRLGYLPALDVCRPLHQSSPAKEYTLTFQVPTRYPVHYGILNQNSAPVQTTVGGSDQYTWTFRNLPAFSRAPEVNLQNGDVPALLFTTFLSSQEALKTLAQQFDQTEIPEVRSVVNEITQNTSTQNDQVMAILNYVKNQIDYCPLPLSEVGYQIRPAREVLRTAYATETEKINLLNLLLRTAKIPTTLAAAYHINTDPANCGLSTIDELTILTEIDGKTYRLNPRSTSMAAQGHNFLLNLENGASIDIPNLPSQIAYQAEIRLTPRQARNRISARFSENYIPYEKEFVNQLLPPLQSLQINNRPDYTEIQGEFDQALENTNGYVTYILPEPYPSLSNAPYASYNSRREVNLKLPSLTEENYHYQIELPAEMQLCTPATEKKIENAVGSLHISITAKGGKIEVDRRLQLRKQTLLPADYPAFWQLMTTWSAPTSRRLLLKINH